MVFGLVENCAIAGIGGDIPIPLRTFRVFSLSRRTLASFLFFLHCALVIPSPSGELTRQFKNSSYRRRGAVDRPRCRGLDGGRPLFIPSAVTVCLPIRAPVTPDLP